MEIDEKNIPVVTIELLIENLAHTLSMKETFAELLISNSKPKDAALEQIMKDKTNNWRAKIRESVYVEYGKTNLDGLFG